MASYEMQVGHLRFQQEQAIYSDCWQKPAIRIG